MKTIKATFFILMLFASTLAVSGGNLVGNAGDPYTAEFNAIAKSMLTRFQSRSLKSKFIRAAELEKAITETFVSSQDHLYLWNDKIGF